MSFIPPNTAVQLLTPAQKRDAAIAVPGSPFFPIQPLAAQQQSVYSGSPAVCGIERVYPRFPNGCERCPGTGAASACASASNNCLNGRDYYNPSGAPFFALGTGSACGGGVRGCLDPTAANYDKLATVHCADACVYRQPKVCILPPPVIAVEAKPCANLPDGVHTAEQAIYMRGAARALQQKQRNVFDWTQ